MNSLAMLRWNQGGRNVSCTARMRGGRCLGQRVVVFKIVHRLLRVLCVSVSSVFKQTRRLRSCMTSSRAVGRCVRHRGHRDTEDTEEFRDFASTTLPTTDGRICCLAITAGAPRSARGLFVYTL